MAEYMLHEFANFLTLAIRERVIQLHHRPMQLEVVLAEEAESTISLLCRQLIILFEDADRLTKHNLTNVLDLLRGWVSRIREH